MANSQNGYKADGSLIASYTVPDTSVKISMRKGDVSVVLLHFAAWFDANIQKLQQKETGGYNPRSIVGSNTLSNHASGTAIDVDWNEHPISKVGTFTAAQTKKIRAQLKFYDGVIRWGGDYTGRKDEMHFEINKGASEVAAVAKKIRDAATPTKSSVPPKPPAKPAYPTHIEVDGGLGPETIKLWQHVMGTPVDGKISEPKSALIEAVQNKLKATVDHRMVIDGELDRQTIGNLQRYLKSPVDQHISQPKSQVVMALQRRLNAGWF